MKYMGESGLSKLLTLIKTKIEGLTAFDVGAIPTTEGAVGAGNLASNAVTSDKIESGAVSNSFQATLADTDWSDNQQIVSDSSVTANNTILTSPAPASYTLYTDSGVRCISQGEGFLTFQVEDVPTEDIIVNITVINK